MCQSRANIIQKQTILSVLFELKITESSSTSRTRFLSVAKSWYSCSNKANVWGLARMNLIDLSGTDFRMDKIAP